MGRDRHEKRERAGQTFVMLLHSTLDSPAWRALSHGARSLYTALRRRYIDKFHNNGKIYLSQRKAQQEIGSGREEIGRWFRELQHYGFIVQTSGGCLGVDGKGRAPHWRLTEVGYMKDAPTREFARWDGTEFIDKKTKSRPGKPVRPGPEIRATTGPEIRSTAEAKWVGKPGHIDQKSGPEIRTISKLPSVGVLPDADASSLAAERSAPVGSAVASEAAGRPQVSDELRKIVHGRRWAG